MTSDASFQFHKRCRWLCVAYAFPPISRSGTHRTLAFVKHLARRGWDATVITAEPNDEAIDQHLSSEVPASCQILRTPWLHTIELVSAFASPFRKGFVLAEASLRAFVPPCLRGMAGGRQSTSRPRTPVSGLDQQRPNPLGKRLGLLRRWAWPIRRLLTIPDSRIGWWPFSVRAGLRAIREDRPDVIYSTSPYATAHLIALWLHLRSGIPWVADFRDPWCGNPFDDTPLAVSRSGPNRAPAWERCANAILERVVLRNADHVICNTPTATAALRRRCPFVAAKCSTILNGADFEALADVAPVRLVPDDCFLLLHCGQFYGRRRPHPWFAALQQLRKMAPNLAARTRFISLGHTTYDGQPLESIAERYDLGAMFQALAGRDHHQALAAMAGSDVLVLAAAQGPGSQLQVPNKLFEYLALRRPILLVCEPGNPSEQILKEAGADYLTVQPSDVRGLAEAMCHLATRRSPSDVTLWSGVYKFDRLHRAAELESIFAGLLGKRGRPLPAAKSQSRPVREVLQSQVYSSSIEQASPRMGFIRELVTLAGQLPSSAK